MTVATELLALGAPDHVRAAILGHEHGSVLNRHYTQANLKLMKGYLDRICLALIVEFDERHGFPVIRGCSLLKEPPLRVNLTLGAADQPKRIEVHEPSGVSHMILPDPAVDPKDPAARADNLDRMGQRLAAVLAGRRYRIEGMVDETVHRVLGVLLAVAFAGDPATTGMATQDDCSRSAVTGAATSRRAESAPIMSRSRLGVSFGIGGQAPRLSVAPSPVDEMAGSGPRATRPTGVTAAWSRRTPGHRSNAAMLGYTPVRSSAGR